MRKEGNNFPYPTTQIRQENHFHYLVLRSSLCVLLYPEDSFYMNYVVLEFSLLCIFIKSPTCSFFKDTVGFPGGAVVENLPANAGDTGSSPGLGRSHMPRSNKAREPQLLSLRVWSLCSATREAAIVRGPRTAMKSGPRSPQLEKALAQKRRPNTAKNK